MPQTLSPKELAHALGLSESSLKRWADDGLIHVSRTAGGHRRITLVEAVRFIRHAALPIVHPGVLGLADLESLPPNHLHATDENAALAEAIRDGRAAQARGLLLAMYLAGRSVAEI